MQKRSLGLLLACATSSVSAPGMAESPGPAYTSGQMYHFEIGRDSLAAGLMEFSRQTGLGVSLVVEGERSGDALAGPLNGRYTAETALAKLLTGSGLTFMRINDATIAVVGNNSRASQTQPRPRFQNLVATSLAEETVSTPVMLPIAASGATAAGTASGGDASTRGSESRSLEEVIVSAQKTSERLQDVPVPVSALSAELLVQSNQTRIQDFYARVPGLSLTMLGSTDNPVPVIRGLTTGGYTVPTVGTVIDDIPFGGSTIAGGGFAMPDVDPNELARVEVLRGPQGTLYGASSLGGLIKYVTIDPSTDMMSGRLQAGVSSVRNGDGVGYNVRGAVNLPLGETLAVRVGGYTRREPGYIDDPVLGREGINERTSEGGRIAALWQPSDTFSVKLSALVQQTDREGEDTVHRLPGYSDLEHHAFPNTGWTDTELQAYSATVTAKVGKAEITSLTGYSVNELSSSLDLTQVPFWVDFTQMVFGVSGVMQPEEIRATRWSQELRVSMPLSDRVDWLLGAFYTDEDYPKENTDIVAVDASGAIAGSWYHGTGSETAREMALFTAVTVQMTDRFDMQFGARQGEHRLKTDAGVVTGPFNTLLLGEPNETVVTPGSESKDTDFTYLLTPRLKLSPDMMLYARFASGYRPGGPNPYLARSLGQPPEYSADTTRNYEFGAKGTVLDQTLMVDASVYYIDWRDIQVQLKDPGGILLYYVNAGRARSQGVELSLEARPTSGLSVSTWAAYSDASLAEDFPASANSSGKDGDRLPYSSRFSANLSVDQEFDLASGVSALIGASASFVGDRKGRFFTQSVARETFPSYTQVDVRAALTYDTWRLDTFINNVADERGVLRAGLDASLNLPYAFTYIQPRTIGMSLTKTF